MPTLKKQWDDLVNYSITLSAGLVITLSAFVALLVIGAAILIAKLWVFIK